MNEEKQGVSPTGPGHSPKGGARKRSPAKPSVPDAARCCEGCAYAAAYPPAGPEPELPEAPKISIWSMGHHFAFAGWEIAMNRAMRWRMRKVRADSKVECRRFPEFVERAKGDVCGEFAQGGAA